MLAVKETNISVVDIEIDCKTFWNNGTGRFGDTRNLTFCALNKKVTKEIE